MVKRISQRQARAYKKRVEELERAHRDARRSWCDTYPDGVGLGYIVRDKDWLTGRIEAARMLGHPVVVISSENRLHFYAVK